MFRLSTVRRPVPRLLAIPSFLGLLCLAGCDLGSAAASGELEYKVTRGDLVVSFTERGNVKAASSEQIYSMVEGRSTIVRLVAEGTFVKKGDILVELDSSELTQTLNQQEIAVEASEAALEQAREETKIQTSLSNSDVRQAKVDKDLAELDLEKYEKGDFPLAVAIAEGEVTLRKEQLQRAQNEYEWTQKLAKKGYVTGTELVADRLKVHEAELREKEKIHSLKVLGSWTHTKDLKTYTFAVEQAGDALTRTERKRDAEIAKVEADERAKKRTHDLNVTRLKKIRGELGKTKILAPQDGMVVYHAERYRRERVIEQGADVRENQLLMNLPDVSTMAVELSVHESWVDQVRVGLPALVSIDAMPDLNIKGKISKVGILPDSVNRWMNPDLKVYRTVVTIDESEDVALLKPGMSAKVQLVITVRKGVLFVPVQSVTTIDQKQVCFVLEGGRFTPRPVETGKYNESLIEIASGLEEGMIIQLNAPAPSGTGKQKISDEVRDLASDADAVWRAEAQDGSTASRRGGGNRMSRGRGERSGAGSRGEGGSGEGRQGPGRRGGGERMSRGGGEGGPGQGGRGPGGRSGRGAGGEGGSGVDWAKIMKAARDGTLTDEDLKAVPAQYRERMKARLKSGEGFGRRGSEGRSGSEPNAGGGEGGSGS